MEKIENIKLKRLNRILENKENKLNIEEKEEKLFFGREKELSYLKTMLKNSRMEGIAVGVYGVRRGGKTATVEKFIEQEKEKIENSIYLKFLGDLNKSIVLNVEMAMQEIKEKLKPILKDGFINFEDYQEEQLTKKFKEEEYLWEGFFLYFKKIISLIPKEFQIFVFFDEAAWFSNKKDYFIEAFSYFWNHSGSKRKRLLVFLASSLTAWLKSKVFNDVKGMYKRLGGKLEIKPFTFQEIMELFKENGWIKDKKEILKYYLIFGGFVKHYLENQSHINFSLPLSQNEKAINNLYKYIEDEYKSSYAGVFSERKSYQEIVELLCKKKKATAKDIQKSLSKKLNLDYLKTLLIDLKNEGFIQSFKEEKEEQYFADNQLIQFYYHYVKTDTKFKTDNGKFYNWQGQAFEFFVVSHIDKIKEKLGLRNTTFYLHHLIKNSDFDLEDDTILAQIDILLEVKTKSRARLRKRRFFILECKFYDNDREGFGKEKELLEQREKLLREKFLILNEQEEELNTVEVSSLFLSVEEKKGFVNVLDFFESD